MTDAETAVPPEDPPRRVLKDWHAVLILGALVAVFFWKILLHQAFLWEDFLVQVYPFRSFAAVSLSHGELPLWNPYAFAGMPFQADIQSAVFYIPHLLLTFFVRNDHLSYYALEVMLIAHFWLAAAGMYFLAKEFELEPPYALFSALVFGLSGFMIVHAIHPGFVEQAAWLPWIILFLHRSITRRSIRSALVTGVLAGHAVLAGAPQISLYLFFLVFVYTAFLFVLGVKRDGLRAHWTTLALPALAVVVALGVAAIQLLPTLELAPLSERDTISVETAQVGGLAWQQLVTAVMPKLFGASDAHSITFWLPAIYGGYWETCFYCGLTALFTVAFATTLIRRNTTALFLVGLLALSFMLAVGNQFVLFRIFFAIVPGFSRFRGPARILLLATFASALLGGMGLRAFVERAKQVPHEVESALLGALAVVLMLWAMVRVGLFLPPPATTGYDAIRAVANHEARMALILAVAALGAGLLLSRRLLSPALAIGALLIVQYVDITRFGSDQNTGTLEAEHYYAGQDANQHGLIERVQEEGKTELFRITPRNVYSIMLDRNEGMVEHLYMTDGYTALRLRRLVPPAATWDKTLDLLNSKYRVKVDTAEKTMSMRLADSYLPHALLVPIATVITDDSAASTFMRAPDFDPRRTLVLDEPVAGPLPSDPTVDSSARIGLVAYRANTMRLQVAATRPAFLLLSEIYYPGWQGFVDGVPTPIYRADWNLRAMPIAGGSHTIVMNFKPPSFAHGAMITLLTLVAAAIAWLVARPPIRSCTPGDPAPTLGS